MKTKILTLVIALSLIISSCSSDDSNQDENFYIKTKINGELVEYKYDATANLPLNGNTISGYAKAVPNQPFPAFDFEITDPTGIKVQNYAEPNNDMIFRLAIEGMITYTSQHVGVEDFNINITEITSDHVKGTFSGKVFLAQSTDGTNFSLTEGEFFLRRDIE
jgi:PBP1b-binding outer membrane lipoprotein LpoB